LQAANGLAGIAFRLPDIHTAANDAVQGCEGNALRGHTG
jgi:hypothetical protein